jgi:hypothetical protein
MKITSILALALAPLTLAKTLTLYVSSHETGYFINFPNDNSVDGVKLSDDKGSLKVYGSLTFTQPGETMIALNNGEATAWVRLHSPLEYIRRREEADDLVYCQACQGCQS